MPRPNILWIVTTQWRGQALGCAGDPNARTPHLDALAARGRHYGLAFTPHPFGPFARAALLTGIASPANGIRDYFDPLPAEARTVAHALGDRGYRTGFFGKWHLSRRDPGAPLVGEAHARQRVPVSNRGGFEHWEGFESGFQLNDPWLHGTGIEEPRQLPGYQSDVVATRAAGWCRSPGDVRPWFCVVSLEPPHPPYAASSPGGTRPVPDQVQLPVNVPRGGDVEAKARSELAGYYAHIEATDRALGRLFGELEPVGAMVVFTSVHGDMHGAHGLFRKGWPYEESIRVPLIVAAQGKTRGLIPQTPLVSLLDLPAWATAWAEGKPLVRSRDACEISMPSIVALPRQCDRVWNGIRTAGRKLVLNEDGTPWLYFDLMDDPWEQRNLADAPDRREEREQLRAWWSERRS